MTKLKTVVITGCSSIGKTTLATTLLEKYNKLSLVKSFTTRKKRPDDINYIHITIDEFKDGLNNKLFADYSEAYKDTFYGVKWDYLYKVNTENKIPLLVTNIEGAINYSNITNCLVIHLFPENSKIIEERIKNVRSTQVEERISELNNVLKYESYFENTFKITNYFDEKIDDIFKAIDTFIK